MKRGRLAVVEQALPIGTNRQRLFDCPMHRLESDAVERRVVLAHQTLPKSSTAETGHSSAGRFLAGIT